MNRRERLCAGLEELRLKLDERAITRLVDYVDLLEKWNKTYNLTAIREGDEMVVQHLLDSLAIVPLIDGDVSTVADIGSGAGLPGIPLAIVRPACQVTLIDSVQKKSAFQQQAKIALKLSNVSIYSGRVEDLRVEQPFDAVVARAFAESTKLAGLAAPLLRAGGKLFAMKGQLPHEEITALPSGWRGMRVVPLTVPGLGAERHLLILEKS